MNNNQQINTEKFLDEVLQTEPDINLSDNFADLVVEKVNNRFAWNQYLKEFFLYLGVFVFILIGIGGFSLFWFKADWKPWLDFVLLNAPLVVGISLILLFILFSDKVLLRYLMFKSKLETR